MSLFPVIACGFSRASVASSLQRASNKILKVLIFKVKNWEKQSNITQHTHYLIDSCKVPKKLSDAIPYHITWTVILCTNCLFTITAHAALCVLWEQGWLLLAVTGNGEWNTGKIRGNNSKIYCCEVLNVVIIKESIHPSQLLLRSYMKSELVFDEYRLLML